MAEITNRRETSTTTRGGGRPEHAVSDWAGPGVIVASVSVMPADMLRFPYAVDTDGSTLAIADTANNRVMLWDRPGPQATAVLGQPDFGANGENRWSSITRDSLCWPYGISLSGDRLAIADSGNNRVVIWQRMIHMKHRSGGNE